MAKNKNEDRLNQLLQRDIPELDASRLRTGCGLPANVSTDQSDIPLTVKMAYWKHRMIRDRIDMSQMTIGEFVEILKAGGQDEGKPNDVEKTSVLDMYVNQKVKMGAPIIFRFRSSEIPGTLMGVTKDRKHVLCQAENQAEVREIRDGDVRLDPSRKPKAISQRNTQPPVPADPLVEV